LKAGDECQEIRRCWIAVTSIPFQGRSVCHCDVQRRLACGNHSGIIAKRHSGIARKPFAFPPESPFAFSPESRSPSARNSVRDHPGIPFAIARNPLFMAVTLNHTIVPAHDKEASAKFFAHSGHDGGSCCSIALVAARSYQASVFQIRRILIRVFVRRFFGAGISSGRSGGNGASRPKRSAQSFNSPAPVNPVVM
jgi:hypothetical protein